MTSKDVFPKLKVPSRERGRQCTRPCWGSGGASVTCGDKSHGYRDALEQKEFPSCFTESRGVPCCGSWHRRGETLVLAHESCSCPTRCSWVIPRGSCKDARVLTCCFLQLQEHQLCFQFPSTAIDTNIYILYLTHWRKSTKSCARNELALNLRATAAGAGWDILSIPVGCANPHTSSQGPASHPSNLG